MLDRIRNEGPRAASDLEEKRGRSGWWEWSDAKQALEWLFWAGHITTATRRGSFERVYDLTERVIPAEILALPTPDEKDAQRALVERAAQALGVATAAGPARLFPSSAATMRDRRSSRWSRRAFSSRSRFPAGPISPISTATRAGRAASPRGRCWRRSIRSSGSAPAPMRLFDFHYRIEIYTPVDKRQHGYYVLPFLLGDRLVARLDLKADRQAGRLLVHAVHLEPHAPSDAMDAISEELQAMADWLGLADIVLPSKPSRRARMTRR